MNEEYIFDDAFYNIIGIPESQRPETEKRKVAKTKANKYTRHNKVIAAAI